MTEYLTLGIPFLGTVFGAAMALFMRRTMRPRVEKFLLGFASGVMIAASVWSLLIPAIELSEGQGKTAWLPAAAGFLAGMFFLSFDGFISRARIEREKPGGAKTGLKRTTMLVLAVTLHNLPEGMAVGVAFAGALLGNTGITMAGVFTLAVGIGIQNFPEGAIISMPLRSQGMSKGKSFLCGVLSGVVEPLGSVLTILLTARVAAVLPYLLAFAAGAMIYVVVEELIPEAQAGEHTRLGTAGVALGFVVMMVLDVALG